MLCDNCKIKITAALVGVVTPGKTWAEVCEDPSQCRGEDFYRLATSEQPERSKRDDSCTHEWHEQIHGGGLGSTFSCCKCEKEMRCSELCGDIETSAEKTEAPKR